MKTAIQCLALIFIINMPATGAEPYQPNSGDKELDEKLILIHKNINRKNKTKLSQFVDKISEEFQVPPQKVEELFNHYEFNAPDVLMSVSIADVSGEPLQNIAGVFFKNKSKGWKYALRQLNISKNSATFTQIKKDMSMGSQ